MTTPKEALERIKLLVVGDKIPNWQDDFTTTSTRGHIADLCDAALASLEGDAVERVARIIDPHSFQAWQGLYDYSRKEGDEGLAKRCADHFHKAGCDEALAKARAILATGLVPDEAAIRADEREKCAKVAEGEVYKERYRTWPWWKLDDGTVGNASHESAHVKHADAIASAIRSNGRGA